VNPSPSLSFLDPQQRYQLLENLPSLERVNPGVVAKVKVLDCQPYQISPIVAILANQSQNLSLPLLEDQEISSLARSYIQLQSTVNPGIPVIYDTWLQGDRQVIILEDRSEWKLLSDVWQEDHTSLLQILSWCYQMTQLWTLLEPVKCRRSLLELSNLLLDEDQTIAVQELYSELATDESPDGIDFFTPPVLGRVWQILFRQAQKTQFGSVVYLLEDLEFGKIDTISQLRSRLEEIARELETTTNSNYPNQESDLPTDPDTYVPEIFPEATQDQNWDEFSVRGDDIPTMILEMQLSSLDEVGQTDVGRQRNHNEDFYGIESTIVKYETSRNRTVCARGLYILCDGMGGHAGGEVASELAVNSLRKYFQDHWLNNDLPTEQSIKEAIILANQTIYDQNQREGRSGAGRMGTTLVLLLIQETRIAFAHVGDSRLYRLTRKAGLQQLTLDHEVGQREISRGVSPSIAYSRTDAYQLTQALGPRDQYAVSPDIEFLDIHEDTLLLLVSDGLSDNNLLENNWELHLAPLLSSSANLEHGITELIDLANQYNGHDNITAIAVRIKVRPSQEPG
jgi:protein phosphatase